MGPQLGPQTPRNWSNLGSTHENNRHSNTLTRNNLGDLTGTLVYAANELLISRFGVRVPGGALRQVKEGQALGAMALGPALFRLGVCVPIVCQIVFLTIPTGIANLMLHEQGRPTVHSNGTPWKRIGLAKGRTECRPPAAMAGASATTAVRPLVLHSAHDHHAFHEDAKPGDLSLQFGTRWRSSSSQFTTTWMTGSVPVST